MAQSGGVIVRTASPGDAMDVAHVHIRSWQAGYRGLLPDEYLDQLRAEQRAQQYDFANADPAKPRTMVAVGDGVIQGFATAMPARDADLGKNSAHFMSIRNFGGAVSVAP